MKALVISHNAFSKVSNNGKTLESIFSCFDSVDLAQIYFYPQNPDLDYCFNFYRITDIDIIKRIFLRSRKCGGLVSCSSNSVVDENTQSDKKKFTFFSKYSRCIRLFRDILWKTYVWKTKELIEWLKKFNPDVIFFLAGDGGFAHQISWYISRLLSKPLVVYITDDYFLYKKNESIFERIHHYRIKRFMMESIKLSSFRFAIGELMAKEYSLYFGKKFDHIVNSVDIRPFPSSSKYSSPFVVSYFGGLHLNRWKMLVRIVRILNDNILLRVYTSSELTEEIKKSFNNYHIEFCGCVVGDELYNARLKSDILLHVESDDEKNRAYTRLAISTKIPEYLISGRVVLGFGPEEVASMRILSDNNIGLVISSDKSDDAIRDAFWAAFSNVDECENMRKRAYEYAKTNFDKKLIASRFKSLMQSVCSESVEASV